MRTPPKSDDLEPYQDAMNEPVLIQVYHLAQEDGREFCVRPSREELRTNRLIGASRACPEHLHSKLWTFFDCR